MFLEKKNFDKYHPLEKEQIKFFWITLNGIDLKGIMKEGSFLINFDEGTIKKN